MRDQEAQGDEKQRDNNEQDSVEMNTHTEEIPPMVPLNPSALSKPLAAFNEDKRGWLLAHGFEVIGFTAPAMEYLINPATAELAVLQPTQHGTSVIINRTDALEVYGLAIRTERYEAPNDRGALSRARSRTLKWFPDSV